MKKIISWLLTIILILGAPCVASAKSEIQVILDGRIIEFDQPPVIISDRTMVPMRAIYEALGAEVNWDPDTRTASGSKTGITVSFTIDEALVDINHNKKEIDAPATIVNDRTLVPVRALAEGFGVDVKWDAVNRTVLLTSTSSTVETKDELNTSNIDKYQIADEKIEIQWLGYATLTGCREGTAPEKLLESTFNVELKPIFVDSATYQSKKSSLLATGEIPDLIYELHPSHVYKDVQDQFLSEVPYEVVKKFAPSIYNEINDKAPAAWSYSYYDEKNWGVPNINRAHLAPKVAGYRQDWLDAVDMEIPTTVDGLHDVLKAFKDKNLGSGYVNYSANYPYYFGEIFGAYGVLPFNWQEVNGKIVYGGLRPEVETVLSILQKWYSEGIIDPGFAEYNRTGHSLLQSGQIGYTSVYHYNDDASSDMTYAPHIKGPDGKHGMRGWGYPCHIMSFGWTNLDEENNDDEVKMATILNMMETLYTDEDLLMEVRYGKEGETYEVDYDSTASSAFVPVGKYVDAAERRLNGYEFGLSGPTFWTPFAPSEEMYSSGFTNDYKKWYNEYDDPDAILVDAFCITDIIPSVLDMETLRTQQIRLMNQIIMGNSKVRPDQFCEEFEKIWKENRGEQMLKEAIEQKATNDKIIARLP